MKSVVCVRAESDCNLIFCENFRGELQQFDQIQDRAQARDPDAPAAKVGVGYNPGLHSAVSGYGSLQPQQSQGLPQSSSSSYLAGPTALQIKQRLQIGAAPTLYHSDGMESDDSLASDNDR